jgi:tetratricopeptide (TPR) repeat protein
LLIGDLYLDTNRIEQARKAYLVAKENDVEKDLFIDRWRKLARAYSKGGDIERAINTLREYRDVDPVVFDYDIDQLHKQMIRADDRSSSSQSRSRGFSRGGTRDY